MEVIAFDVHAIKVSKTLESIGAHEQCLQFTHHKILPWLPFCSKMLFLSSVTSSIVKFLEA